MEENNYNNNLKALAEKLVQQKKQFESQTKILEEFIRMYEDKVGLNPIDGNVFLFFHFYFLF